MTEILKRIRSNKIVDRRLQAKVTSWFVLVAVVALGMQYVLTVNTLAEVAMRPYEDPSAAFDAAVASSLRILGLCLLFTLPVVTVIGILATFRLLGPVSAFRRFLEAISRGEQPGDLQLRRGDELQELCELLNRTTRSLRETRDSEREAA